MSGVTVTIADDGEATILCAFEGENRLIMYNSSSDLPLKKSVCRSAAAAAKSLQSCPTLCDSIDSSPPGFPSLGFSRQEHWSGLPFPSPVHESEK